MKPHEMGVTEAAQAIANRQMSSLELVSDCLAAIDRLEPSIQAWAFIDPEWALQQAREMDRKTAQGLLHGVPIGLKDIIACADTPTAYGSAVYAGHRPPTDAACATLLKRAGAVLMGKTVTTEFAYFSPGKTRNPHNLAHTPGGSSSGSAAAVASCMVPAALGSQTAGSLIRPASYCGVVGYKPTYGDFNLTGVKGLAHSLDTLGVLTRSVRDAGRMRSVLLGGRAGVAVNNNPRWAPAIGVCRTADWLSASPHTRNGIENIMLRLAESGARVGDACLPARFDTFAEGQKRLMAYEAARSLASEYDHHAHQLSYPLKQLIELGLEVDIEEYGELRAAAEQGAHESAHVFEPWDVLLAPSAGDTAPLGISSTGDPLFSRLWMFLGVPTLSLPALTGANGLPIGIQLIGARFADDRLLQAAAWIESTLQDSPALLVT